MRALSAKWQLTRGLLFDLRFHDFQALPVHGSWRAEGLRSHPAHHEPYANKYTKIAACVSNRIYAKAGLLNSLESHAAEFAILISRERVHHPKMGV